MILRARNEFVAMTRTVSGELGQFVSIIIRAYHSGQELFRTLESCMSLDYDRSLYEVIVVIDWNDQESNRTVEAFRRHNLEAATLRVIESEINVATKAWNTGIRFCRGDIVLVCPDDVIVHASSVRQALKCFSGDEAVGALTFVAVPEETGTHWVFQLGQMRYLGLCSLSSTIFAVTAFRKSSLEKIGTDQTGRFCHKGPILVLFRVNGIIQPL